MHARSRLLFAGLLSTLLLAHAAGSASASRLSLSETGFKFMYSPISFVPSFGSSIKCPVTLEGSFHGRTASKTAGALAGFITRASLGTCEAGRARFNTETLPWHLQYGSFEGTLPNITGITEYVIRPSWEMDGEIFGLRVTCRYTAPRQGAVNHRESRGVITEHRPLGEAVSSETSGCPTGRPTGTATVKTPTGGTISVSLI